MTNTTTRATDLSPIACLLARSARAIRAGKLERGLALLCEAEKLIERLPRTEAKRACQLFETLAIVGWARTTELKRDACPAVWADAARPCTECGVFSEPCLGCGV
jgi:hypothetical protein